MSISKYNFVGQNVPTRLFLCIPTLVFAFTSGCFKAPASKAVNDAPLSQSEREYVRSLQETQGSETKVPLVVSNATAIPAAAKSYVTSDNAQITELNVPAAKVEEIEKAILASNPNAAVAVNFVSDLTEERPQPFTPDEGLLFSGKEEFGLAEWKERYPDADGRGISVGIVDDGVSLDRPGLLTTSTGLPKIARSIQASPLWQFPLYEGAGACAAEIPAPHAASAITAWKVADGVVPALQSASVSTPIDITPCGIHPELTRSPRECVDWNKLFPDADKRKINDRLTIPALFVEFASQTGTETRLLIDVNGDNLIEASEALAPISSAHPKSYRFSDGRTLGFDVHATESILPPSAGLDHPIRPCASSKKAPRTLTLTVPEAEDDFGSHGEGVAAIAAGYRIGGRSFDGVAPGAQIVDVHFADEYGGRRYSIAEIGRNLKMAGTFSEIVNLSYSLYFSSPVSQVAMGRFLESTLKETKALYLFSAGNNGPGIGSMNRALVYPSIGIPVAAYLNPRMAQTTFGSLAPYGGVVNYSSRGPGVDGASGPLILSPLAGIVPATAQAGFRPFSGTSSATPALAGFTARLLSQIKASGLKIDRVLVKEAILQSALPIEGFGYTEQGYGIPKLLRAFEIYKSLAEKKLTPVRYTTDGRKNSNGVSTRGIYVRGNLGKSDVYNLTILPEFSADWTGADMGAFADHVKLSSTSNWLRFPQDLLISRAGSKLDVAPNWEDLQKPGLYTAEISVDSVDGKMRHAIIPVTIIVPEATTADYAADVLVPAGQLKRIFVEKPAWATHIATSRELVNPSPGNTQLCGAASIYAPNGTFLSRLGGAAKTPPRVTESDNAFATTMPGVYEIILAGANSHTICAKDQTQRIRVSFLQLDVSLVNTKVDKGATEETSIAKIDLQLSTLAPKLSGSLTLSNLGTFEEFDLTRNGTENWEWSTDKTLNLSNFVKATFFVDEASRRWTQGYPAWSLFLFTKAAHLMPFSSYVSSAGTELKISDLGEGTDAIKPVLSVFDYGIPGETQPQKMRLAVKGVSTIGSIVSATMDDVQATEETGALIEGLTFEVPKTMLPGAALDCSFRPARFNVKIPCGHILLP
jgi:hypothetical protein